jgi:hypothetical protein
MDRLFYCYSTHLKDFFVKHGLRFLHMGMHNKTQRKFYVFDGNEQLNSLLQQWRLQRP